MSRRTGVIALLLACCLGIVVIGVSAARDGMTYYRTTTELLPHTEVGESVRVGGLVIEGSMRESPTGSRLTLTDGATPVVVHYPNRFPDVIREGEGAVVEGTVDGSGELQATTVLLRHSNEYGPTRQ